MVRWVYYCVDDFSQWPGLEHAALDAMEREMVERADVIIAVSEVLRERIGRWGRHSLLLTHGVDLRQWSDETPSSLPRVLERFEPPFIVFWGLIDQRIDVDVVRTTAAKLERGTIVLIGPDQNAAPRLWASSRVARIPAQNYDDLPALARAASVLIMPYVDAPVTRAMQPLKLKEYLATGKPTVVTDLPSVREWNDCLDIATSPDEFADAVKLRLQSGLSERQRLARQRLSDECWTAKARRFERLIDGDTEASDLTAPEPACDEALAYVGSKKALGC
ncbi:MAG TPA: glycosyltransferase [Pirellulales bacterium]|nr:glycosyltransferase [Pirellulales bacterium]